VPTGSPSKQVRWCMCNKRYAVSKSSSLDLWGNLHTYSHISYFLLQPSSSPTIEPSTSPTKEVSSVFCACMDSIFDFDLIPYPQPRLSQTHKHSLFILILSQPTSSPSLSPSQSPSKGPSVSPSTNPTEVPTSSPSKEVSFHIRTNDSHISWRYRLPFVSNSYLKHFLT